MGESLKYLGFAVIFLDRMPKASSMKERTGGAAFIRLKCSTGRVAHTCRCHTQDAENSSTVRKL